MKKPTANLIGVACGVFRPELEALCAQGKIDFPIRHLDSMLHMRPDVLRGRLDEVLRQELGAGNRVLILYGDCHAHMHEQASLPGVCRLEGRNCAEVLLGRDLYNELSSQGAFLFLPEWTGRWEEVFHQELRLTGELGRCMMTEFHAKLTYVDTGVLPVPTEHLEAASAELGLPWDVVHVGTDNLLAAIHEALERISAHVG